MSFFAWIDTSPEDQRRVLEAIEQLKESDSRDELGLATIRDGFANTLFPGTGTLQTRLGYFLFVPWIYRLLHKRKLQYPQIEAAARKEEISLIDALLASDDTDGVIGKISREKLKRLPSSVYWNGLRTWRIFENDLSIDEYHRQFEMFRDGPGGAPEDERAFERLTIRDWHPALPEPPNGFPRVASFKLRRVDREFLAERITLAVGSSLLAWLLRFAKTLSSATPWDHPQLREFPEQIRRTLLHAHAFSEAMHGAPFLYNLMLAEELPPGEHREALVEKYRGALGDWSERLGGRQADLAEWRLSDFWEHTAPLMRVAPSTRSFVADWVSLRGWEAKDGLADAPQARQLIRLRERQLKGPRARIGNQQALALWGEDSGTRQLLYRWPSAVRLLWDLRPELAPHAES